MGRPMTTGTYTVSRIQFREEWDRICGRLRKHPELWTIPLVCDNSNAKQRIRSESYTKREA